MGKTSNGTFATIKIGKGILSLAWTFCHSISKGILQAYSKNLVTKTVIRQFKM
ncbi:hypothetical protein [Lysinibacillus sphaericus]|uniref:hypothetical protein n=1 Tax=Lysinibacillus sphaericus TaxID=1421 RepID=UPI0015B49637|nr:hypothetical protein [Lysinibacillus sphaericus]